ncbi:hypothetical protein COTS27_00391 [Spirochaetota bacterium]|nr:hypothetical protein COTS27_00391 [Spirochaetota bacterium]
MATKILAKSQLMNPYHYKHIHKNGDSHTVLKILLSHCRLLSIWVAKGIGLLVISTTPLAANFINHPLTAHNKATFNLNPSILSANTSTLNRNSFYAENHLPALAVAEAYQALATERVNKSAQICFELLRNPANTFNDPYYILGTIHLNSNLHSLAITYYNQGLTQPGTFLIRENAFLTYYYLSEAYYKNNQPKEQIASLETLLKTDLTSQGMFYENMFSKAHFLLALAYWGFEQQAKSLYHLNAMLQNNYKTTIAHLLLAYYYAQTPQSQITLDHKATLPAKYNLTTNDPDKKQLFNFYYNHFTNEVKTETTLEQIAIDTKLRPYMRFIDVIYEYRKVILDEIKAQREADFNYLNNNNTSTNPNFLRSTPPFPRPTNIPRERFPNTPAITGNTPKNNPKNTSTSSNLSQNSLIRAKEQTIKTFNDKIKELYLDNDNLLFLGKFKEIPPQPK